jgi:hypothetical protein
MRILRRGRKYWAFLVPILAAHSTLVFPQPANIYTFNPDVKITDAVPRDGTSGPMISSGQHYTAFRGDTVYVVWWESRISNPPTGNHIFFAKSTDCGVTFSPSKRVNDISAGFNPSMLVDSSGNIYVAYQRLGNIYFTKSIDRGNTFTPSVLVVDSAGLSANQEEPTVAVTNKGHVFIAWVDGRTTPTSIFTATSYDGGQTFRENVRVGRGYRESFDLAADENGRVYVAYPDTLEGIFGLVVARSVDSGNSFSPLVQVVQGVGDSPSLAVSKDGRIGMAYVGGGIRFSVSNDFGQTFSPSVQVAESGCQGGQHPSLTTSNGIFYVAWDDGQIEPNDSFCVANIFLSYSHDGGNSFVPTVPRDTSTASYNIVNRPSLAVNEEGKAFAAWIDDRLDPALQDYWYMYGATAIPHFVKGDLNLDGILTLADVVMELNAVFLGRPFPASFETADVNCDAVLTAADVVLHLNATFLGEPFPCSI